MNVYKVNNRPTSKSWNGLVNELFSDLDNFGNLFSQGQNTVPVNISENDQAYTIEVLAPARDKEQFSVKVEKDLLTIGYEEKAENEAQPASKKLRSEFSIKSFKRSFNLDDKINAENIEAKYEAGILTLVLPKKAEVKPEVKQISIQ